MHSQLALFLLSLLAANTIVALPLNINLGAYSPALVVGDGEISFGGKQDVTNLMNALEGAAVSSATANGVAAPQTAAAATTPPPTEAQTQTQAQPATQAEVSPLTPDQLQEAAQIAALQGISKEIAPRVVSLADADVETETEKEKEKRDINGFNAALKYATGALTTSPKVQLGTGAEGSGVGILQDAGGNRPAAAAAAVKAKRDEISGSGSGVAPKMRTTVTTMYVRGGRGLASAPAPADWDFWRGKKANEKARNLQDSPVVKRAPSPGIDGVNLNVAEGQVAELTFVETRELKDEDEE
ncbi:hypothetical protein LARI1_G003358 [Lachnellula arida]|uniref:Uncharacterized protein n=1 Tax=Lachnellula arida TaxID=1316785 RepID=A0A8T9BMT8_9HELO|nr:hypothetical protein LARI1_G003358 [Lachnellula arida]